MTDSTTADRPTQDTPSPSYSTHVFLCDAAFDNNGGNRHERRRQRRLLDQLLGEVGKRAGVNRSRLGPVAISSEPWQLDDRAWFAARPDRSHRLRPLFPGELETGPELLDSAMRTSQVPPPGYGFQIVVRQVERGVRIRFLFNRNLSVDIPDDDAIIRAIFDTVSAPNIAGDPITAQQIGELAIRYAEADDAGPRH